MFSYVLTIFFQDNDQISQRFGVRKMMGTRLSCCKLIRRTSLGFRQVFGGSIKLVSICVNGNAHIQVSQPVGSPIIIGMQREFPQPILILLKRLMLLILWGTKFNDIMISAIVHEPKDCPYQVEQCQPPCHSMPRPVHDIPRHLMLGARNAPVETFAESATLHRHCLRRIKPGPPL